MPSSPEAQPGRAAVRPWSVCTAMFVLLLLGLGGGRLLQPHRPTAALCSTLDPNFAAWWELATLPGLGEHKARAIVEHRGLLAAEGGVIVFRTPADLDGVSGIGPVIVQQLAPHLVFGRPAR